MKIRLIGHIYPADKNGKHLLLARTDDPCVEDVCTVGTMTEIHATMHRVARSYDRPFLP